MVKSEMKWYISFPKDFVSVFLTLYAKNLLLCYFSLFGNEIAYLIYLYYSIVKRTYVLLYIHCIGQLF